MRKYPFNEHYFQRISSSAQAYWLGFITADGGISAKTPVLALNLAARDDEQIVAFQQALGRKCPLRYARSNYGTKVVRFAVSSELLIIDLKRCGVGPRKSLVQRAWDGPRELMRHYWRGVFDGDGSLGLTTKANPNTWRRHYWVASLTGSRAVIAAFRSYVVAAGGTRGCLHQHGRAWKLTWGGIRPACFVARLLYRGKPKEALSRKLKLAQKMICAYRDFYRHSQTLVGRLRKLVEQALGLLEQKRLSSVEAQTWIVKAREEIEQ